MAPHDDDPFGRSSATAPAGSLLSCEGLVRRYGDRTAVAGVSFHIAPGETYGLLGPNGAGKTTTISMIAGILEPDEGTVLLGGSPVHEARRMLGLVPQQIALIGDLSAAENLRFFGGLQGLRGTELARRTAETLELVGLADRAGDRISTFSGGMQRRANLAVGLLHEPRLLVLDEPTAGVDPQSRNQILESIERLGDAGIAVLYTTHYMEEAERLCDRVGIIDQGRLIAEGTRRELVERVGQHDRLVVRGAGTIDRLADLARTLPGVAEASAADDELHVAADDAPAVLAALVAAAPAAGVTITGIELREPNLEAVFLHLTGKALRDRSE